MNVLDYLGFFVIFIVCFASFYMYNMDTFSLRCIISSVDGHKYCVRDRAQLHAAADLLAKITSKCVELVEYVRVQFPEEEKVKRLVAKFNPRKISEILPTSNYTAYSENKGEKIAFCLTTKKGSTDNLIDEHTLMFVAIHELSHVMSVSIGHKEEFWDNFRFLLDNAKKAGIHEPRDYSKKPIEYCSLSITDSPYFQLQ
jgi:hypothetical protein